MQTSVTRLFVDINADIGHKAVCRHQCRHRSQGCLQTSMQTSVTRLFVDINADIGHKAVCRHQCRHRSQGCLVDIGHKFFFFFIESYTLNATFFLPHMPSRLLYCYKIVIITFLPVKHSRKRGRSRKNG